jgi:hypothetical protein
VDISRGFAAFAVDGNAESRLAVRSPTCAFAGRTFATGQGADDDDKDEDAAEDDILDDDEDVLAAGVLPRRDALAPDQGSDAGLRGRARVFADGR